MATIPTQQLQQVKEKIQQQLSQTQNPKAPQILSALGITDKSQLSGLSDQQLESRINEKLLGILGLSMRDIQTKK